MDPNLLLIAAALAVSPLPVLASVLLLTSQNGRAKAAALAAGWVTALAVIGAATVALAGSVHLDSGSTSSGVSAVLDVVLGVVSVVYAVVLLRRRESRPPSWLGRLDKMSPVPAFALGAFIPPYVLVVAGANQILRADTSTGARGVAVAIFVVVGSIGCLVPLIASFVVSDSDAMLARWRTVLDARWQQILAWLLVVLGVYLVVKGVVELTSN